MLNIAWAFAAAAKADAALFAALAKTVERRLGEYNFDAQEYFQFS